MNAWTAVWTELTASQCSRCLAGTPQILADGLTVRRAEAKDACAVASLFHSMYRDSSHPFQSIASVREFLEDNRNFQILAEADNRVVASMAMTCNPWNDSYELGRAVTIPEYRRNGLAGYLMQQVVDWVAAAGSGELIFGYPRVRRIAELCAGLDPRIVVVGHDAGRNVANGSRETHLIVCGIPRHARFTHVAPVAMEWLDWRFLREQIYASLGLAGSPGQYPVRHFAGTASRNRVAVGAWVFDYAGGDPSGALDVIGRRQDGATPRDMSRELDKALSGLAEVRHVTATLLADKVAVIRALIESGFELCAYLPAWYREGQRRYDCVQLARRQYSSAATTQDFPDLLDRLRAAFSTALSPAGRNSKCNLQLSHCGFYD
jgi:GNAT superfamily N-acetyltransferase